MSGVTRTTGNAHEPCTVMLYGSLKQDDLLRRVRGEFREMPGMRLTLEQAMRLWDLDRQACGAILDSLIVAHFLQKDAFGRFRLAHGGY
jgi:hypothetical protein